MRGKLFSDFFGTEMLNMLPLLLFSLLQYCASLKVAELSAKTPEAKAKIRLFRATHFALAAGERRSLKVNIERALSDPTALKVLSFDSTSSFSLINMRYPNNPVRLLLDSSVSILH